MISLGGSLFKATIAVAFISGCSASTASPNITSSDTQKLDNNAKDYYLGYRSGDSAQPWANYYDPVIAPLTTEFQAGIIVSFFIVIITNLGIFDSSES
jgi:hypothetical protein